MKFYELSTVYKNKVDKLLLTATKKFEKDETKPYSRLTYFFEKVDVLFLQFIRSIYSFVLHITFIFHIHEKFSIM